MVTVDKIQLQGDVMPWSLAIMLSTWSTWSHSALILSNGNQLDSSPVGGVKEHKPGALMKIKYTKEYDLTKHFDVNQRYEMYQRAKFMEGAPYDWWWIIAYPFNNRNWEEEDSWVCFEYVAYALKPWIQPPTSLQRITGRQLERRLDKVIGA